MTFTSIRMQTYECVYVNVVEVDFLGLSLNLFYEDFYAESITSLSLNGT